MTKNKHIYFHNLNGIRFLAALAVIVSHIEYSKHFLGLANFSGQNSFFTSGGSVAVSLFFVLSGFLITYLLIKEKEKNSTINFKKFIIRRALRIWPLYFLFISVIIFFVHGITSEELSNTSSKLALFYLIMPNAALSAGLPILHISHLWSIGVEEQFYIIWPVILKFFNKKLTLFAMLIIIISIPLLPHFCDYIAVRFTQFETPLIFTRKFFQYFKIDQMAFGGLGAYAYTKWNQQLKNIVNLKLSILFFLTAFFFLIYPVKFSIFTNSFYGIIFTLFILVLVIGPPLPFLENRIMNKLGQISYGLYTIHWVVIYYSVIYLKELNIENTNLLNILIYGASIVITIILSLLSYELIEKNFLKFKNKFTIISSGRI